MENFKKLFKKVNGLSVLKQYAKSHVLLLSLIQTFLNGFSKKSLEIVRLSVDNKILSRLRKQNSNFIKDYLQKHEFEILEHKHSNIIWVCWMQGIENAPELVQKCYDSLKENIKGKEIILLTEDNYMNYVEFPSYIQEKINSGIITKTHFSDLLRLELLIRYGGTWIDATVFCSGNNYPEYMFNSNLFLFQTLKPGLDGQSTRISSWFMTSCSNHKILLLTRELLYNYWKNKNHMIDYFLLHDFFELAIETYPEEWEKVVPYSNSTPHILLLRLFEQFDPTIWEATKQMTCIHKLTYKFDNNKINVKGTYYDTIFN